MLPTPGVDATTTRCAPTRANASSALSAASIVLTTAVIAALDAAPKTSNMLYCHGMSNTQARQPVAGLKCAPTAQDTTRSATRSANSSPASSTRIKCTCMAT
jgi:hypothetical protein